MVFRCPVSIRDAATRLKKLFWPRPANCPRCRHSSLWGHGFVYRFFNGHQCAIPVKRWRCHRCKAVITCRPQSHWNNFQESIQRIFKALLYRVTHLKWPPWTTRQRGGHWLRKLLSSAKRDGLMKGSITETISFYQAKNLLISQTGPRARYSPHLYLSLPLSL